MAAGPARLRIRSYNVGFGDCFLLSFFYARARTRHVLIDFGSTKAPPVGPKGGLLEVANRIAEDCEGKLNMVVATHRHADHISGFGDDSGEVIKSLEPDLVLQPWTERPDLAPDAQGPPAAAARRDGEAGLVAGLASLQGLAEAMLAEVPALQRSPSVRRTVREQISFLGETNLANRSAVVNLMNMGARAIYASFGTKLPIARLLPGVGIDVLGPPTLKQSAAIAKQRATDPDEFWHLAAAAAVAPGGGKQALFANVATSTRRFPQEARWVIPEIERMRSEEMLALVRVLDSVLNNTSLILLFEVGGKRLLFPGDAQIENWSYALFTAPDHEAIRERLAGASLYKVGHHGSLNATPKTLWNGFEHRGGKSTPGRLTTMVSTLAGKHGSVDRGTEVPRQTLITELRAKSALSDTEDLRSRTTFWNDVEFEF